ncbi:hypothetical protein [Rhizobium sp. LjRoot258]|jgi:hypothetical protein|uniref:hypothetical protein n=1 Tax=Rhizobium sp. LjRoot258 TaxID=3342299 RepID=UPI003ECCA3D7
MSGDKEPPSAAWRGHLRLRLEDLVDSFVVSGVRHEEIFEAIIQEIGTLRQALKRNADPADDRTVKGFLDEPSNDWPAADDR